MPNPKGNPEYKLKYGEKTRVVRLPESIAEAVTALLKIESSPVTVLQTLDSQPIVKASKLPAISAVYFVATETQLLYIGRAQNLKDRFISHHRKQQFLSIPDVKLFWFPVDSEHSPVVENSLIGLWEPELNGEDLPEEFRYQNKGKIIGFRCPDELASAIHKIKKETGKDTTTLLVEAINFWLQNKPVELSKTSVKQDDERIQELIDNKTSYLADAMNEVKHSLESQIEALKTRLTQQEIKLGEY